MSTIKIGGFTRAQSWAVLPRKMAFKSRGPKYHVTIACDVNLGTQTSSPIWRKERKRRQEEGDIALLAPLTVGVVKNKRKKGFRMYKFPADSVLRAK